MPVVVKKVIKPVTKIPAKIEVVVKDRRQQTSIPGGDTTTPRPGDGMLAPGKRLHLQVGQTLKTKEQFEMLRLDYGESTEVYPNETTEQARERLAASVFEGYTALLEEAQKAFGG